MLSVICEAFQCRPSEATQEDWAEVRAILDYRLAEQAVEAFSMKDRKAAFKRLEEHPALGNMLVRMHRAQGGASSDATEILKAYRGSEDDGDPR